MMGELIKIPEYVIGVDEVGLGALAGPIVICAFAARKEWKGVSELDDSKKTSDIKRERVRARLWAAVVDKRAVCCIESRSNHDVDLVGLAAAHRDAVESAIRRTLAKLHTGLVVDVIIDGNLDFSSVHVRARSVIQADSKFVTVSAASIVAKCHRDEIMSKVRPDFYGFAKHKGYPTAEHKAALCKQGPSPLHRWSTAPVAAAAKGQ